MQKYSTKYWQTESKNTSKNHPNIYTLEYYSVVKKNDVLNFAFKWVELENTILCEVTQTPKDEYGMYSLIHGY